MNLYDEASMGLYSDPSYVKRMAWAGALADLSSIFGGRGSRGMGLQMAGAARDRQEQERRYQEQMVLQQRQAERRDALIQSQILKNYADINPSGLDAERIKLETGERKDYVKGFTAFRDAVLNAQKLEAALMQNSGAGDYAAVISFVKSLDPTSVVREGEASMAANVAGLYERIIQIGRQIKDGDRLPPEVKADYLNLSRQWLSYVADVQKEKEDNARYRAERYSYDPRAIIGKGYDFAPLLTPEAVDQSYFAKAEAERKSLDELAADMDNEDG